jgi:hypothetical protein
MEDLWTLAGFETVEAFTATMMKIDKMIEADRDEHLEQRGWKEVWTEWKEQQQEKEAEEELVLTEGM